METILGLLLMLMVVVVVCCALFLAFIQPIWGIVDVAVSKEHSTGTKAVIIVATLLCLGPIMTFFYAIFGSRSKALKSATLVSFLILLLSGAVMLGLAIAVPVLKQKLPWWPGGGGGGGTNAPPAQTSAEIEGEIGVDPESVPSFTAVYALQVENNGTNATTLLKFNAQGARVEKISLSKPIPVGRYPFPLAQLALAQGNLVSLVFPSPEEVSAGTSPKPRTYLIDPQSGECREVRGKRKVEG